jgi:hypothetical protein
LNIRKNPVIVFLLLWRKWSSRNGVTQIKITNSGIVKILSSKRSVKSKLSRHAPAHGPKVSSMSEHWIVELDAMAHPVGILVMR